MKRVYKKVFAAIFVLIILQRAAAVFGILEIYYIILKVVCLPAGLIVLAGYLVDLFKTKYKVGEENEDEKV